MISASVATIAVRARPALLAHALRLTWGHQAAAEDLVQEAYVRFVENPPRCRKPSKVKGWLIIVMRNLWFDRFPRLRSDDPEARREFRMVAMRDSGQEYRAAALRGGCGPREFVFAAGAESLDA